jgi:hypothetical protein
MTAHCRARTLMLAGPVAPLAASPAGWMQDLTFYVAGLRVIAFVTGLHRDVRHARADGPGTCCSGSEEPPWP